MGKHQSDLYLPQVATCLQKFKRFWRARPLLAVTILRNALSPSSGHPLGRRTLGSHCCRSLPQEVCVEDVVRGLGDVEYCCLLGTRPIIFFLFCLFYFVCLRGLGDREYCCILGTRPLLFFCVVLFYFV